jgi:hypothetical protein
MVTKRIASFCKVTIALVITPLIVFTSCASPGGSGAPDGPGERIRDAGAVHVSPGQEHAEYTSVPATSGPHYGQPLGPTRSGIHDQQLADEVFVHNLEHGGVAIFYNCPEGCPEIVEPLSAMVQRGVADDMELLLSPYSGMEYRISLNAWTFIEQFDEYDEDRVRAFIEAHHNSPNAPEALAR